MFSKSANTKAITPFVLAVATLPLALGSAACTTDMSTEPDPITEPGLSEERDSSDEPSLREELSLGKEPSLLKDPSRRSKLPSRHVNPGIDDESTCVTLWAGQTIEAGKICVSLDLSVDTSATCRSGSSGVMQVDFLTSGGWELLEAHLAAGDELSDIPTTAKGNPKIGNFPYHSGDITGATSYSFSLPLCTFGFAANKDECEPVTAFLAAHAALRKQNRDGSYQTETGWGDGTPFSSSGSWAEHFEYELSCTDDEKPVPETCETAFAMGKGAATCFIGADFDGDGADDGFSRWGWSNGPLSAGKHSWRVYAGAGKCDLSKGTLVGTLDVVYDGSSATVTFSRSGDFTLAEEHLYIGSEPLPRDRNGEYTVAPGQYPHVIALDSAETTTNVVDGLKGDIYVVYHAVACGSF